MAKIELNVKEAAKKQNVTEFLQISAYLQAIYLVMKEARKKYSYRQFSSDLGFGFTNYLHLICTGQRQISVKAAVTISLTLELPPNEHKYLLNAVNFEKSKDATERDMILEKLVEIKQNSITEEVDKNMLEYLSEWYHPTIREMINMPGFHSDPVWISHTIVPHISVEEVKNSLELLEKIGFIYKDENNIYHQNHVNIVTGKQVRGLGIKKYHHEMLNLSRNALDKIAAKDRDFQALTLPMNEQLLQEIKNEISRFWKILLEKTSDCPGQSSVYQMNIQFFPTMQSEELDDEKK